MNIVDFEVLCKSREVALRMKLNVKQRQYGSVTDVFRNNKRAAALAGLTPERYLTTQFAKHAAVLCDYAEKLDEGIGLIQDAEMRAWRESMDDISVWMFILNGLLEERYQRHIGNIKKGETNEPDKKRD